jgi:hypothetical protein
MYYIEFLTQTFSHSTVLAYIELLIQTFSHSTQSWVPFLFGNGAVSSEIGGNVRSSDHLFDPSVS